MSEIIDVNTGEISIGMAGQILTCRALGSCIAVVIMDRKGNLGGIAHIMLAGKAPFKSKYPNRYAENGIKNLIQKLNKNGASGDYIACLAGAGNVLKRLEDTICSSNEGSVASVLNQYNIPIIEQSLGGFERRSVKYDIEDNQVFYTIADSDEMLLYEMSI